MPLLASRYGLKKKEINHVEIVDVGAEESDLEYSCRHAARVAVWLAGRAWLFAFWYFAADFLDGLPDDGGG